MISSVPVLSPIGVSAAAQNTLGGTQMDGNLRITVTDGNVAVERYDGSSWVEQYYSVDSSDTVLYVDGALYDVPGGGTANADRDNLVVADQSVTDGGSTVVTTFEPVGDAGVVLTQRISYTDGQEYFDLTWDVENTGGSSVSNVRLLHGKDTYLAGGDNGHGFWHPDTNAIGVNKTVSGEMQRLSLRGITDPYAYQSDNYGDVADSLANGALTNDVDTSDHDNGYAMEWRTGSIGAGGTWTVRARESFTQASVVVTGPGTVALTGDAATLQFDVTNVGENSASVSFTTSGPSGWTISTPASTTIAGGATETVTVVATPPNGTSDGRYDVTLTASSDTSTDADTAQVRIGSSGSAAGSSKARARLEITDHSLNRTTVAVGQPVGLSVTVTNVGNAPGRYQHPILTDDAHRLQNAPAPVLAPGESHTYHFTVAWADVGINRLFFGHHGVGEVTVLTAEQLRPGELTLRHAYLTRSAVASGENYSVVAVVENDDDRQGTLDVGYRGGVDGNESANRTVTLAPGDVADLRIARAAPSVATDTTLSWAVTAADDENGTRINATDLTVRPASGQSASGIVDAYVTRATVEQGEHYNVVAVVRNTADQPQLFAVTYDASTDPVGPVVYLVWVPADRTVEVPHHVTATQTGTVSWTVAGRTAGSVDVTAAAAS
ncbi:MAG: NEW3 domain-containing protein [Haloarculaceae archaeon]